MAKVSENAKILTITETGYGRCSSFDDYRTQARGGKGITNYRTAKYGDVAGVLAVDDDKDIIMMASDGVIIRISAKDISTFARPSKGVRVMKFKGEDAYVLQIACVEHDDEEETVLPDAPDADSADVGEPEIIEDEVIEPDDEQVEVAEQE